MYFVNNSSLLLLAKSSIVKSVDVMCSFCPRFLRNWPALLYIVFMDELTWDYTFVYGLYNNDCLDIFGYGYAAIVKDYKMTYCCKINSNEQLPVCFYKQFKQGMTSSVLLKNHCIFYRTSWSFLKRKRKHQKWIKASFWNKLENAPRYVNLSFIISQY